MNQGHAAAYILACVDERSKGVAGRTSFVICKLLKLWQQLQKSFIRRLQRMSDFTDQTISDVKYHAIDQSENFVPQAVIEFIRLLR